MISCVAFHTTFSPFPPSPPILPDIMASGHRHGGGWNKKRSLFGAMMPEARTVASTERSTEDRRDACIVPLQGATPYTPTLSLLTKRKMLHLFVPTGRCARRSAVDIDLQNPGRSNRRVGSPMS